MDPPDTPSPAPRLRRSPKRKALHERSHSHTNEILRPTIRLVTEDDAKVYSTTPFPTSDSQILTPSGSWGRTHVLDASPRVSRSHTPPATSRPHHVPSTPPINAPAPRRNQPSKHYGSIADALAAESSNPPSTPATQEEYEEYAEERYSPSSNTDVDRRLAMDTGDDGDHDHEQEQQDIGTPAEPSSSTSQRQHARPSAPTPTTAARHPRTPETGASLGAIASRASGLSAPSDQNTPLSTASVGSSGTVVRNRASQIATPAGYYRLFPPASRQPGSVRSTRSNSDPLRPVSMEGDLTPPSSGSPGSPVSPMSPTEETPNVTRHSVYSSGAHSRSETALDRVGQDVRIPILPPPAEAGPSRPTSGELEETEEPDRYFTIPRRPVGQRRDPNRWTLALSTVMSESTEGRSSSGNGWSTSRGSREQRSLASSGGVSVPNFPLPDTARDRQRRLSGQRVASGSSLRVVSATDKELPPLPERNGDRLNRPPSAHIRPTQRNSMMTLRSQRSDNRDSGASYSRHFQDTIPAWARTYYAHEARNRATIGARPLSDIRSLSPHGSPRRHTTIASPQRPTSMRIPRGRRPRASDRESFYRDSMAITPLYDQPSYVEGRGYGEGRGERLGVARGSRMDLARGSRLGLESEHDWSPRLYYDRRSAVNRRTVFLEPSIDLSHEGRRVTRRNVQVWAFAGGFVLPFAWIIAAFLPLPPKARTPPSSPGFEQDLEKAYGPRDQARFENARWWRNINRVMSVLGVGVIVAVIVLVVIAATRGGDMGAT